MAQYLEAIGTIRLDAQYGIRYNKAFLKECLAREMQSVIDSNVERLEDDHPAIREDAAKRTAHAKEVLERCSSPGTVVTSREPAENTLVRVAPCWILTRRSSSDTDWSDVISEPGDGDASIYHTTIQQVTVSYEVEDYDVEYFDELIPFCRYLYAIPEWAHCIANMTYSSGLNGEPVAMLTFRILGYPADEDRFAETIEKWWRRTMIAYNVSTAVCSIHESDNAKTLTEKDIEKEFIRTNE